MTHHPYQSNMPYGPSSPYNQIPYGHSSGHPNAALPNYPNSTFPYQPGVGTNVMNHGQIKNFCKQYKDYYVLLEMNDGQKYDGIIDKFDETNIYMLVPDGDNRELGAFGYGDNDYGFGGYGPGYGPDYDEYGYGGGYVYGYPRRFRRFRRYRFPFQRLTRAILFPFFY